MALEFSIEKIEKDAHNNLAELQRLQLEHQMLKTEKNDLQVSYETLGAENVHLKNRVIELESEKDSIESFNDAIIESFSPSKTTTCI